MTDYISLAQAKTYLKISLDSQDDFIQEIIDDASEILDRVCGRPVGGFQFGITSSKRYFDIPAPGVTQLTIPPFRSITTLKADEDGDGTFERTWTENTDFYTQPYNESVKTKIVIKTDGGRYAFPIGQRTVEIDALWGDLTVPGPIRRAMYLMVARYYQRQETPLGIYGNEQFGFETLKKYDPDVAFILDEAGYRNKNRPLFV